MNTVHTLVAAFLLATAIPSLSAQDACSRLQSARSIRPSDVSACYNSFPFSRQSQAQTAKALNNVLAAHAFTDVMANSPNPAYQANVDPFGMLRTLSTSAYKSDYEFQVAVSKFFDPMQDGHFSYTANCYRRFSFLQPFVVHAVAQGNANPKITIIGVDDKVATTGSMQLSKYIGAELVQVDGEDAYQHLQKLGDELWSKGKDPNVRFNRAIAGKMFDADSGTFVLARGVLSGRTFPVPKADSVRYTLRINGQTQNIDVPWITRNSAGTAWQDASSYWKTHCAPKAPKDDDNESDPGEHVPKQRLRRTEQELFAPEPVEIADPRFIRTQKIKDAEGNVLEEADPTPILTGPDFGFFVVERSGKAPLGVFAMGGFAQTDSTWVTKMKEGFKQFQQRGVQRIVLDLSNDGGGTICTAYTLLRLLTPGVYKPFATDFRLGRPIAKLFQASYQSGARTLFHPSSWVDERTGRSFRDLSIVSPARPRVLTSDGKTAPVGYSQLVRDGCSFSWDGFELPYAPKDMVLLTNGFCASSCAIFASHLYENSPELKHVVSTALPRDKTVSSVMVPGGQVYHDEDILKDIRSLGLQNDADLDFNFPQQADVSFVLREAYSRKKPGMVLDYLKMESHGRVEWTEANGMRPERIWLDAAKVAGF